MLPTEAFDILIAEGDHPLRLFGLEEVTVRKGRALVLLAATMRSPCSGWQSGSPFESLCFAAVALTVDLEPCHCSCLLSA